jgi:hypothetical protein
LLSGGTRARRHTAVAVVSATVATALAACDVPRGAGAADEELAEAADEVVQGVLDTDFNATVYRGEDEAIYFLDRGPGQKIRLRRWNAQRKLESGRVQTLATFHATWKLHERYSLVAGTNGDLGLVAWNGPVPDRTRYGRLRVDASGRVSLASVKKRQQPIVAQPALTPDGFVVTLQPPSTPGSPRDPVGGRVDFTGFHAPGASDAAVIHPH